MIKKYKKLDFNTTDLESLANSDLKKLADYWLRQFLLNSKDINPQYCPIKKRHYDTSKMQVAHYEDRGNLWTRYNLTNCHLLSAQSNMWDAQVMVEGYKSLHHKEYGEWLIKEYGVDVLNILRKKAENKEIFKKENYIEVINKFRNNE